MEMHTTPNPTPADLAASLFGLAASPARHPGSTVEATEADGGRCAADGGAGQVAR
ncbi:hypothetical protein ACFQS2_11565 [Brachybacterium sp. GCM10030267]|uniref:hypothetical protein n=1 Tax=unclassified Brachybacterium TaxID=2623841 RepID=UPI0036158F0D